MGLFLEFHAIQSFAPSNLNRDDTGAPKDAIFGGRRRARVSSQCFKRAVRLHVRAEGLLPPAQLGVRTKRLLHEIERLLPGRDAVQLRAKVRGLLAAAKLSTEKDKSSDVYKTQYLLFLGAAEIQALANLVDQHWDALPAAPEEAEIAAAEAAAADQPATKSAGRASKRAKKQDEQGQIPPAVIQQVKRAFDGGKAVDVALFGRMLADLPAANQDAACQVAHALSTHQAEREFDFYTAVDDQQSQDEDGGLGAGMMGHVEFNAATLYRYAALDLGKLLENLQGDQELVDAAVLAFIQAMTRAIPSGKQNGFAAQNLPDLVALSIRQGAPMNLVNAFEKPIVRSAEAGIVERSVDALAAYAKRLGKAYGREGDQWCALDLTDRWEQSGCVRVDSLSALAAWAARAGHEALVSASQQGR